MGVFPQWLLSRLPYHQDQPESILEEQRKIKERAGNYDRIINEVGFIQFLTIMQNTINDEIASARKCPLEPDKQRLHVVRWDAMQEVVDIAQADINESMKERDRINKEEREYLQAIQQQQPVEQREGE